MIKMLSKHFSYAEGVASNTAKRRGIDNTPPDDVLVSMVWFAENVVEKLRDIFGAFTPTSWFRSWALNKAVGGSKTSQHPSGTALDFSIRQEANLDVMKQIYRSDIVFDQLIDEFGDWVHISACKDPACNRREVLRYRYVKGKNKCEVIDTSTWSK